MSLYNMRHLLYLFMEFPDQRLCAWESEETFDFNSDRHLALNSLLLKSHHPSISSSGFTLPPPRKQNIKTLIRAERATDPNKFQDRLSKKGNKKRIPKPAFVKESYHCFAKDISYPSIHLSSGKEMKSLAPACKIDNVGSFMYELEPNFSNTKMIVRSKQFSPCHHQLERIINQSLKVKERKEDMLRDEEKQNTQLERQGSLKTWSTIKLWCKFPNRNNSNHRKGNSIVRLPLQKVKKCLSTHFEIKNKCQDNQDRSTFEVCAMKIL